MKTLHLLQALRNATDRIQTSLRDSNLFGHMGDRGEFRERVVEQFLRPFLPPCYGLGSGQVFATDGSSSRQQDVVIYDDVFSNVLFRDESNSLFPCESVFGTVEIKSNLSSSELGTSIDNIQSVKALVRDDSDMMDILPFRRIPIGGGLSYGKGKRNHYIGVVFAYDGLTADSCLATLNAKLTAAADARHLPDIVINFTRGYSIYRAAQGRRVPLGPHAEYDSFISYNTKEDTLPLFYLTLNVILNDQILKATPLNRYHESVLQSIVANEANSGIDERTS